MDLLRVTHENQAILKRIQLKEPHYNHMQWVSEQHLHMHTHTRTHARTHTFTKQLMLMAMSLLSCQLTVTVPSSIPAAGSVEGEQGVHG